MRSEEKVKENEAETPKFIDLGQLVGKENLIEMNQNPSE